MFIVTLSSREGVSVSKQSMSMSNDANNNVHDKRVDQTSESATFLHNASSLHLTSIFSITQYGYLFKGS